MGEEERISSRSCECAMRGCGDDLMCAFYGMASPAVLLLLISSIVLARALLSNPIGVDTPLFSPRYR